MTIESIGTPLALEERAFILNERMKDIGRARTRIDGRIIEAERIRGCDGGSVERIPSGRKRA